MRTDPLYIRGTNPRDLGWAPVAGAPARSAPLATLSEVSLPGPKITLHAPYKVRPVHLPAPPVPQFLGFSPLSKKFLKIFSPNHPGTVRRALNRRAAPTRHPKTPEFRGKTAYSRLAAAPKSPAKHRLRALKHPPFTSLHIKKLSKVRSTLLTPLPGECILEYMRLKGAAQTTPHGAARAAPSSPKLSNYPASH